MKMNLIFSEFNKETGVSVAEIETPLGRFRGRSVLWEEDKDIVSNFAGCNYAELKAIRKALKEEIKHLNFKIKVLTDFKKVLMNLKNYNPDSVENKRLRKEIYLYEKKKKEIQNTIADVTNAMLKGMEERPEKIKKIKKTDNKVTNS